MTAPAAPAAPAAPSAVDTKDLKGYLEMHIGQKMMFCAARFHWRGIVSAVFGGSDTDFRSYVVLSHAAQIETTGEAMGTQPNTEDPIGGDIVLNLDAVEVVYQPSIALAPLHGEE